MLHDKEKDGGILTLAFHGDCNVNVYSQFTVNDGKGIRWVLRSFPAIYSKYNHVWKWTKVRNVPRKILINFIFILHPSVSINKELKESQKCHGNKSYQGHCGWDGQGGYCSVLPANKPISVGGTAHLFLLRPTSPRSSPTLWGRRPAPSPSSGLSYATVASSSGSGLVLHLHPSITNRQIGVRIRTPFCNLQLYYGFIKDASTHLPNWSWNIGVEEV